MVDKVAPLSTAAEPAAVPSVKRAPERRQILPIIELSVLAIFALLPLFLADYLTVFFTRVVILSLLAVSFDLVWGYAGILSFGQALFYGTAAYSVALMARDLGITAIFIVLPAALLIGLVLSYLIACFLLLGRRAPSVIFVALGTLTGAYAADRLARGWYYLGGQNGIPSIPQMTLGSYAFDEGPVYYYLAFAMLILVYVMLPFSRPLAIRPRSRRNSRARSPDRLLRLQSPAHQDHRLFARRLDCRPRRRPLCLP